MKSTIYNILLLMICGIGLVSCSASLEPGADLHGRDLSNQQLIAMDLHGADLSNTDLTGSNLAYANLSAANLSGANLSNANLADADLQGANLTDANLTGATLDRSNLSDTQGVTDELLRSVASAVSVRRDSFDTIIGIMSPACQGIDVPQATAFDGSTEVHPVILINIADNPFPYSIPRPWSPLTTGETQLVACYGQVQKRQIEVCQYTSQSGGAAPSIARFQSFVEIRLVAAQTGATVDVVNAGAPLPSACPSAAPLNTTSIDGPNVGGREIRAALAAYVAPSQTQSLTTESGYIMDFRWASEGDQFAILDRDGVVSIGSVADGAAVLSESSTLTDFTADAALLSPDGKMVIVTGAYTNSSTGLSFWDGGTWQALAPAHGDALAWSPDGDLAAASTQGEVVTWDVKDIRREHRYPINYEVSSLAWSPDGTYLAGGSEGEEIYLWDTVKGEQIALLEPHLGSVDNIAWSPDSTRLAFGKNPGNVHILDVATHQILFTLAGESGYSTNVAWSPDGTMLATTIDLELRLWNSATGTLLETIYLSSDPVDIAWSPNSKTLAIQTIDIQTLHSTVVLWSVEP